MPRTCTVCTHPERHEIESALVNRSASYRVIASQYSITQAAVGRHVSGGHIAERLAKAREAEDAAKADELLMDVRRVQARTLIMLRDAERARDLRTALAAVREARNNIALLAEMRGQLDRRPVMNVLLASPEWVRVRMAMMEALEPYDEARGAVASRLLELEDGTNGNR